MVPKFLTSLTCFTLSNWPAYPKRCHLLVIDFDDVVAKEAVIHIATPSLDAKVKLNSQSMRSSLLSLVGLPIETLRGSSPRTHPLNAS